MEASSLRLIAGGLIALAMMVHYGLWFSDQSLFHVMGLQKESQALKMQLEELRRSNAILKAEARSFTDGLDAVEERARSDLGLIKPNETFYQIIESEEKSGLFGG